MHDQHHDGGTFEPDTLLPSQYFDRLRGPERSGAWRLVVAMLEDAIHVYRAQAGATEAHKRKLFEEAEEWIESSDREWVFSFENVCDILGLEASYLRRGLRAWKTRARRTPAAVPVAIEIAAGDAAHRKASGE